MQRKRFSSSALVAVVLTGVVVASTATALAARSAASPLEIVATSRYTADCTICEPFGHVATFTSSAPFCESGTVAHLGSRRGRENVMGYACADGSGTLTLAEHAWGRGGDWAIVEGSGRYAGLHGIGSYFGSLDEHPTEDFTWVFERTLRGFADADDVAPSASFTSASAKKLPRVPGAYVLRVGLSLRDDVEANHVAYSLRVKEGPEHPRDRWLHDIGWREGTTASDSLSTTLRVWPTSNQVRKVRLLLNASDPVGNEVSLMRWLTLPR